MQHPFTTGLTFSRRDDHAGVRNRNTDTCHNLCKRIIVNAIIKGLRINVIGSADTRHADRMRSHTMYRLKVFCVHQKSCKFITVQFQPKQYTDAYIVNPPLHGTVHRLSMVSVIVLRSGRMQFFITFFMIGLLKKNISSDSCLFQFPVIFHRCRSNVYIHSADRSVFMFDAVNRLDTFQHIFDRIVDRILPGLQCQTLMPHILECDHFFSDLFLCQLFAADMLILCMIWTVYASIHTII